MLNRARDVSLNVILLGWHPHGHNDYIRGDLTRALETIRNPVLATMPTALNPAILSSDLSGHFGSGGTYDFAPEQGKVNFYFYGTHPYSVEMQQEIYRHITERNEIIGQVAVDKGLPLIDLYTALNTEQCTDFREDFFDMIHPRPSAYPKIARAIAEGLEGLLSAGSTRV